MVFFMTFGRLTLNIPQVGSIISYDSDLGECVQINFVHGATQIILKKTEPKAYEELVEYVAKQISWTKFKADMERATVTFGKGGPGDGGQTPTPETSH
jgi:hypothetical protein